MTIIRRSRAVVKDKQATEFLRDARMWMQETAFDAGCLIEALEALDDRQLTELHTWLHGKSILEIRAALHLDCPAMYEGLRVAISEVDLQFESRDLTPRRRLRTTDALPRELRLFDGAR